MEVMMSDSHELNDEEQEALSAAEVELGETQESEQEAETVLSSEAQPPVASDAGEGGTEAADAKPSWQASLESAGFQSFDDVDNAVRALVDANRQRDEQIKTYADQLRWYQNQSSNYQPAQQQTTSQEPEAALDPLSELVSDWQDPNWANQYIEIDSEGNRVIADHVDETTREKILGIDRKLRQWQEVLQDPRQFAEAVDKRVERMIRENFESSYSAKQSQAYEDAQIDNFINSNANWLYERDPATGRFLQDPVSGDFVYSDSGRQFTAHMNALADSGVSSVASQIKFASMAMGVGSGQHAQSQAVQPQQQTAQQKAESQRNAMRGRRNSSSSTQRSFNGVSAESGGEETGMRQMSFGEETLAALMSGTE
jgi:hypothetical protein